MSGEPFSSPAMLVATGETVRPGGLDLTRRALDFCAFPVGSRVLDVGCGSGATVRFMIDDYGLEASGVDPSPAAIARGLDARPDLPIAVGDSARSGIATGSLDGVIMECVLSITPDPPAAMEAMHRLLRPGGRLILSDMYRLENSTERGGRRTLSQEASTCLCLTRAVSRPELEVQLVSAGFVPLLWEDHRAALKKLGVEIIMKFGSLSRFLEETAGRSEAPRRPGPGGTAWRDISYFLSVWDRA